MSYTERVINNMRELNALKASVYKLENSIVRNEDVQVNNDISIDDTESMVWSRCDLDDANSVF